MKRYFISWQLSHERGGEAGNLFTTYYEELTESVILEIQEWIFNNCITNSFVKNYYNAVNIQFLSVTPLDD
jgi:hypothetical protein